MTRPRSRASALFPVLLAAVAAALPAADAARDASGARAATLPPDFADALVASVSAPTGLAFTPDRRLLITTQVGRLRVYANGSLLATPALDLASVVCTNSERGLLGVAVDPAFATNRFVYLYYTRRTASTCAGGDKVNRVSRYVLPDSNVVDPATETVLVDNIPSPGGNHNGGDLQFGKDGYLYVAIGDGGCDYAGGGCQGSNDAARDRHALVGKILRITKDGGIPPDNPFLGADSARCNVTGVIAVGKVCQETFGWGLRNPFRIAFDPNAAATRFFVNDVGDSTWEEIDLGQSGADYGWNVREGPCVRGSTTSCGTPPAGMTNPIYAYRHSSGCSAITGGAFVPNGIWPAAFDGDYLYADYVCGKIFRLEDSGGTFTATDFVTGLGANSAVAMTFGPFETTQALYYTTYAGGGEVRRIRYTGGANRAPTAVATANPTSGPTPLAVSFDGRGSSDPDGDALAYAWDLDGDGQTDDSTSATPSFTYSAPGDYTVTLRVADGRGGSDTDTLVISAGNRPPVPTIDLPLDTARFRVGDTVTLRGHATDPEDGALADSSLRWKVTRHHGTTHTHPWLPETTGNDVQIPTPGPEDWETAATSYLEIELTAVDSRGLTATTTRALRPRLVDLTFATQPAGFTVFAFATALTGPATVTSWEGFSFGVNAPGQTDGAGNAWRFASWSDGGAAVHTVTTPAANTTYTATFAQGPSIAGFSPGTGAPGSQVTINGLGFTGATNVTIALVKATFTLESPTRITAVVPPTGVSGKWRVTTPEGTATSTMNFTVSPSVAGFAPGAGPPGATVALNGTGFTGATNVTLALVKASFTVESATRMTVVVPATGVSGKWRVTTPAGTGTSGANFTVSPSVTGFSPGRGPPGTQVAIVGTGFTGATQVTLSLAPATFSVVSPTRITAFVPATQSGRWRVTTPAGTATSGGIFAVG